MPHWHRFIFSYLGSKPQCKLLGSKFMLRSLRSFALGVPSVLDSSVKPPVEALLMGANLKQFEAN